MKVYIGADHRGFSLKEKIKAWLIEDDIEFEDFSSPEIDPDDDYPLIAEKVARKVSSDTQREVENTKGIVICGSGVGVDIVANKFDRVRSGLAVNKKQVEEARKDDDINVLALPVDFISEDEAKEIVATFLRTDFSNEKRKQRRLNEIEEIENG